MSRPSTGAWLVGSRLRLHHVYYLLAAFDLLTARKRFQELASAVRLDLARTVPRDESAPLVAAFEEIDPAMERMVAEAGLIFARFRAGQPERAGEHMAAMDQEYAKLNATLARLGRLVRGFSPARGRIAPAPNPASRR